MNLDNLKSPPWKSDCVMW